MMNCRIGLAAASIVFVLLLLPDRATANTDHTHCSVLFGLEAISSQRVSFASDLAQDETDITAMAYYGRLQQLDKLLAKRAKPKTISEKINLASYRSLLAGCSNNLKQMKAAEKRLSELLEKIEALDPYGASPISFRQWPLLASIRLQYWELRLARAYKQNKPKALSDAVTEMETFLDQRMIDGRALYVGPGYHQVMAAIYETKPNGGKPSRAYQLAWEAVRYRSFNFIPQTRFLIALGKARRTLLEDDSAAFEKAMHDIISANSEIIKHSTHAKNRNMKQVDHPGIRGVYSKAIAPIYRLEIWNDYLSSSLSLSDPYGLIVHYLESMSPDFVKNVLQVDASIYRELSKLNNPVHRATATSFMINALHQQFGRTMFYTESPLLWAVEQANMADVYCALSHREQGQSRPGYVTIFGISRKLARDRANAAHAFSQRVTNANPVFENYCQ